MKKKTNRNYIPGLMGMYVAGDDLRSRAQEFFLDAILHVAPAPIFSLRDDVLPKYRAAFSFEKSQRRSDLEVQRLSIEALIDVVLVDELEGLNSLPEYRATRKSSQAIYEAAEELVEWSKRFNLTGKRIDIGRASPKGVKVAQWASLWPLVAALETICLWHFSRAGVVETPKKLPLWRPKPFKAPMEPEILVPIKLKTIYYDPRAAIPKEHLNTYFPGGVVLNDPMEVDTPGWYIGLEREPQFRSRVLKDFKRWLDSYVMHRTEVAQTAGLVEGPGKRELSHFIWTVKYQVKRLSPSMIAKDHGVSEAAVEDGIEKILKLIHLERRPGKRGPKRGKRTSS